MAKYAQDNHIDEMMDETGVLDLDMEISEDLIETDDENLIGFDDEDLEWDLPDAGDDADLDAEEAAAWEAGTLALLDAGADVWETEPYPEDPYDVEEPELGEEPELSSSDTEYDEESDSDGEIEDPAIDGQFDPIPADTDLIPIINTEDIAGTNVLEITDGQEEQIVSDELTEIGDDSVQDSIPVRSHLTTMDYAIRIAGVIAAVLAVAAGLHFHQALEVQAEAARYQTLGSSMAGIGVIGGDQIEALAAERIRKDADRAAAEKEAAEKAELAENVGSVPVTMALSSVQSDLKIKIRGEDEHLISGAPFKVSVVLPSGETTEYEDEDQDGIIYQTGLSAGQYKVTMEQLVADADDDTDVTETEAYRNYSQYRIPTDTQTVEVKDKIAYTAIDVRDEIKSASQVNVAAEDTQQKIATESEIKDTVEWVDSTVEADSSAAAATSTEEDALYEVVDKGDIVDPNVSARANQVIGSFRMLAQNTGDTQAEGDAANTDSSAQSDTQDEVTTQSEDDGEQAAEAGSTEADEADGTDSNEESDSNADHQNTDESTESRENTDADQDTEEAEESDDDKPRSYTTTIKGNTSVAKGSTTVITASTDEPGATTYSWTLDGDAISIDRTEGKTLTVTGEEEGTATLTCTAHLVAENAEPQENVVTTTITVTEAEETSEKRIHVSPSSITLAPGKIQQLSVSLEGVEDDGVSYESAESMIAEVSDDGVVTAVTVGETTITVTADADESLKQSIKVKVAQAETNDNGDTLLKDKDGNQIYVKDNGTYREAVAADYSTFDTFYRKTADKNTTTTSTEGFKYTGWQNIGGKTYYFNAAGEPVTGNQVINGASYIFDADGALTSGTSKVGIDVSQWNGSIDWSSVAKSGVSYAIIRCGYRGSATGALIRDPNYTTNIAGATAAGLKVGLYIFSQATNEVEAVEEASMAIELAAGYSVRLPIFIDVEAAGGRADGLSASARTAVVSAFCQTIQAAGYSAGVYSNTSWLTSSLNTPALTSYHIWVAQYASSLSYARTRYDIWQYSSKGHVSGISGDVDMNMAYRSY